MKKPVPFYIVIIVGIAMIAGGLRVVQAQKHKRTQARVAKAGKPQPPEKTNTDPGLPNGKLITFTDGGTLHVDDAWWRGEEAWFSRAGVTGMATRKVKSIETVYLARVEPKSASVTAPSLAESTPAAAASNNPTWIYLVGGASFKVDSVKETAEGAWYQRGNLVSFLERERIGRIEHQAPGEASQSGWQERGWTSGNLAIDQAIRTNGARFGVDPYLVFLVIEQESHFRPRVVSPKGARGLMQLMPGTARRFAVRNSFDPAENIRGGTQYLKDLLTMFHGRVDLALASYNAGEGRVIGYGNKVPPFQETQNYVRRIGQRYKNGVGAQKDPRTAPAAPGARGTRGARATLAEERP